MHTLTLNDGDLLMLLAAMEGHETLMADALRDMTAPDSGDSPAAIDEQRDLHAAAQSLRGRIGQMASTLHQTDCFVESMQEFAREHGLTPPANLAEARALMQGAA